MAELILAEILKKKRISKRKFAKLIRYEYRNVFRFFKEDYDPKLSTLTLWAEALNVPVCDLIREEKRRSPCGSKNGRTTANHSSSKAE